MVENEIKIKVIEEGNLKRLRLEILDLLNHYSNEFNAYELIGVLEIVQGDIKECVDDE